MLVFFRPHPLRSAACALAALALMAGPSASLAQDEAAVRTAEQLRDRALEGSIAYDLVSELTTRFGPRLAGSASEQAAAAWGADTFRSLGFVGVAVESFPLALWTRGETRVEIVGDFQQPLAAVSLGGSIATPADGIEGDAAIFETYEALLAQPEVAP